MARSKTHRKKKVSNDPSYSKKKPLEFFPIQRKVDLIFDGIGSAAAYGDAGSVLSRLNNRMYRYGKLYDMKLDLSASAQAGITFEVYALSNTWYVQKAFEEAKSAYDLAYADEMENINKSAVARWRDFRISPVLQSSFAGTFNWAYPAVVTNPLGLTGAPITTGDFQDSIVEDSAGASKLFTWANVSNASFYSVTAEYDLAGNQTRTPNVSTGNMPYEGLQADSSTVEASALQTRGQDPPYGATTLPGCWVKVGELIVTTTGSSRLSTGYFSAPCGVFAIKATGGSGNIIDDAGDNISLEVRAGKYKGVSAHNMERM